MQFFSQSQISEFIFSVTAVTLRQNPAVTQRICTQIPNIGIRIISQSVTLAATDVGRPIRSPKRAAIKG